MRGDVKQRSCRWLPLKRHESSGVDRSSGILDLVRVEKETKVIAKRTSVSGRLAETQTRRKAKDVELMSLGASGGRTRIWRARHRSFRRLSGND